MTKLTGAAIGAVLGGILLQWPGVVAGLLVGLLAASFAALRIRVEKLESLLADSKAGRTEPQVVEEVSSVPHSAPEVVPETTEPLPATPLTVAASDAGDVVSPASRDPFKHAIDWVHDFFTSGNLVVKVGVIVLFFGVGFLLKYAVEHNKFPIELRLISTAVGALGLLAIGWRLRTTRAGYALILQGAGIGVLYLTVFAATKLYQLLPPEFAFGVMISLVGLSGLLAILQDARALAVFGTIGGFLAPVLVSTDAGNHVMLFSYYALLNTGVVGIGWFRSWRELNLIGFVFTFIIGALWGNRYYQPDFFASTEPFLVLFFVFYVAIAVLYAHRQPPQLRGYIDGAIVFGVPIVSFGLQSVLVRPYEYALAFSALAMSGVYVGLAMVLWRRQIAGMRLLTEAFLAIGVVFASLAVPLALDGNWTAAAWALEGAAIVWIGVRQSRALARGFGMLLQFGAAFAFLSHGSGQLLWSQFHGLVVAATAPQLPMLNATYLGATFIALAGLTSALVLSRGHTQLRDHEAPYEVVALAWGVLWWLIGGVNEINRFFHGQEAVVLVLLYVAVSALAATLAARTLQWARLAMVPIGLFIIMLLAAAFIVFKYPVSHPLEGWGTAAWVTAFAAHYFALVRFEQQWPGTVTRLWHIGAFLLFVFLAAVESRWAIGHYAQIAPSWKFAAWAFIPVMTVSILLRWGDRARWPSIRFYDDIAGLGLVPLMGVLAIWSLKALGERGESYPLLYLPIANPTDVAQLLMLVLLLRWMLYCRARSVPGFGGDNMRVMFYGFGALTLLWLSAAVGRAVHFWAGISYTVHGLFHSVIYQAALTITWSTIALLTMVMATRRALRIMWFVGATLLGIVVAKLFLIDLTGVGTVARIISFVGVGLLMLIIGYFSPLPPRHVKETTTA